MLENSLVGEFIPDVLTRVSFAEYIDEFLLFTSTESAFVALPEA
jgi:hypothetical protein